MSNRAGLSPDRRTIKIVIVDDEPMVCAHLSTILSSAPDLEIADTAEDGAAAVEAVTRHRPDVVLMDLRMPGVDGLQATERIVTLPDPPIVVALTTFDADSYTERALRAGASGYLLKSTPPEDLINLVRVAADGHTVLSAPATRSLLGSPSRPAENALPDDLTDRERDVLGCLGRGMSNAAIGRSLFLSEATIKGYVSRLLIKLDCSNRTQAGLLAREAGLGGPED